MLREVRDLTLIRGGKGSEEVTRLEQLVLLQGKA
jgi:hypothetical protein